MTALQYAVAPKAFGPHTFRILLDSFEEALGSLSASQLSTMPAARMRDLLARRIISLAEHGELDPERLRDGALAHAARMLRYYRGADRR